MRKYTSIQATSNQDILDLLAEWENGQIGAGEVQDWGDKRYLDAIRLDEYPLPKQSPKSLVAELVQQFSNSGGEPITLLDIPTIRETLTLSVSDLAGAWDSHDKYWSSVDFGMRVRIRDAYREAAPDRYKDFMSWHDDPEYLSTLRRIQHSGAE